MKIQYSNSGGIVGRLQKGAVNREELAADVAAAFPTGRQALLYGDHLKRWRSKLATARARRVVITDLGDSITKGLYANLVDGTTTNEADWREYSWSSQLRKAFGERLGDVGEGWIHGADPRYVIAGGATGSSTVGPASSGWSLPSGTATITITTPVCTEIILHGWWASDAASNPWTYTVDGGGAVAAAGAVGQADVFYRVTLTGLSNTAHTVVITGPATKSAYFGGVECFTRSTGVAVHRLGTQGAYIHSHFNDSDPVLRSRQLRASFAEPKSDLVILTYGANETAANGGQSTGKTVSAYKSLMQIVTTYITDTLGADVLLVAGPRRIASAARTDFDPELFYVALAEIAAANPHVALFDLKAIWGTGDAAVADGLIADTVHPTLRGHSDLAQLVYQAIGGL